MERSQMHLILVGGRSENGPWAHKIGNKKVHAYRRHYNSFRLSLLLALFSAHLISSATHAYDCWNCIIFDVGQLTYFLSLGYNKIANHHVTKEARISNILTATASTDNNLLLEYDYLCLWISCAAEHTAQVFACIIKYMLHFTAANKLFMSRAHTSIQLWTDHLTLVRLHMILRFRMEPRANNPLDDWMSGELKRMWRFSGFAWPRNN